MSRINFIIRKNICINFFWLKSILMTILFCSMGVMQWIHIMKLYDLTLLISRVQPFLIEKKNKKYFIIKYYFLEIYI
jgi:hypothetical protein